MLRTPSIARKVQRASEQHGFVCTAAAPQPVPSSGLCAGGHGFGGMHRHGQFARLWPLPLKAPYIRHETRPTECMAPVLARLLNLTLSLFDAVADGDESRVQLLASQIRRLGWNQALPALASVAGALVMSLEEGAAFDGEVSLAI